MGSTAWVAADTFPLQTSLKGTSATITVGTTQTPAILLGANSTQINAILPSTTPTGNGSITVTYNGQTSAPQPIQVVASAFASFTYNEAGSGTSYRYRQQLPNEHHHPRIPSG